MDHVAKFESNSFGTSKWVPAVTDENQSGKSEAAEKKN